MKRELALRRQLASLDMLRDAVNAMRSASAHHVREAREGLPAARAYRQGIDALLGSTGLAQGPPVVRAPALLLIGSDLGFCDGYNARLVEAALSEREQLDARTIFTVGRRTLPALRRAGVEPTRRYGAIGSSAAIPGLLLALCDDMLGSYLAGAFSSLDTVSARFDGVGAFVPMTTRVLPVSSSQRPATTVATPFAPPAHLAQVAVREYLYSTLFQLLLDALAAEHGARLVATEMAGEWLDGRTADLGRQLASLRREAGTQEVLAVAAGARQRAQAGEPTSR